MQGPRLRASGFYLDLRIKLTKPVFILITTTANQKIALVFDSEEPAAYNWFDFQSETNDIVDYIQWYGASAFTLDMYSGGSGSTRPPQPPG